MKYFITGTDTEVGKTFISAGLLMKANEAGLKTIGLKPVSAGAIANAEGKLENEDALLLQQCASIEIPYDSVNPYVFEPPIAPHIAAKQAGVKVEVSRLAGLINGVLMTKRPEFALVEGAGGWILPLSEREVMPQLVKQLQLPVVMVVGMKLGCLNHAFLTMMAIEQMGCQLVGWVANRVQPDMLEYEENLAALKKHIQAPCLGEVPHFSNDVYKTIEQKVENLSAYLTLPHEA